jgi:hypothetical protein
MQFEDLERLRAKNRRLKSLVWEHYHIFKTNLLQIQANNDLLHSRLFEEKQRHSEIVHHYSKRISALEYSLRQVRSIFCEGSCRPNETKRTKMYKKYRFGDLEHEGDVILQECQAIIDANAIPEPFFQSHAMQSPEEIEAPLDVAGDQSDAELHRLLDAADQSSGSSTPFNVGDDGVPIGQGSVGSGDGGRPGMGGEEEEKPDRKSEGRLEEEEEEERSRSQEEKPGRESEAQVEEEEEEDPRGEERPDENPGLGVEEEEEEEPASVKNEGLDGNEEEPLPLSESEQGQVSSGEETNQELAIGGNSMVEEEEEEEPSIGEGNGSDRDEGELLALTGSDQGDIDAVSDGLAFSD